MSMTAAPAHSQTAEKRKIYEFLKSHPVGTIGTVDSECNPHIAIIYFSANRKFELTFTTKRQTRKHQNILSNSRVMLLAYEAFSQTSVQVTGTAEEITSLHEAGEVFKNTLKNSLKTSGVGIPPISKIFGDYVAYRIKPEQIRMTEFSRANPSNYQIYDVATSHTQIR